MACLEQQVLRSLAYETDALKELHEWHAWSSRCCGALAAFPLFLVGCLLLAGAAAGVRGGVTAGDGSEHDEEPAACACARASREHAKLCAHDSFVVLPIHTYMYIHTYIHTCTHYTHTQYTTLTYIYYFMN